MMFPNAQTACSHTFWCWDSRSLRNQGTAPACTTACVWFEVPEAIFVSAHAASNCKDGLENKIESFNRGVKIHQYIKYITYDN